MIALYDYMAMEPGGIASIKSTMTSGEKAAFDYGFGKGYNIANVAYQQGGFSGMLGAGSTVLGMAAKEANSGDPYGKQVALGMWLGYGKSVYDMMQVHPVAWNVYMHEIGCSTYASVGLGCVGAESTKAKIWNWIGDAAGKMLILKEVTDIVEFKAGLAVGVQQKLNIGPLKGEIGFSHTMDALEFEGSELSWVSGTEIGLVGKAGPWTYGPSAGLEQNKWTGEVTPSFTPWGVGHKSGAGVEPWKISTESTVLLLKFQFGLNLSEAVDLVQKVTSE